MGLPLEKPEPQIEELTPSEAIKKLCDALSGWKYDLSSEAEVQRQIEGVLHTAKIPYKRERWLNQGDRVDFFCEGGVALEVKLKARPREIHRQLLRYAGNPVVKAVVLVTARTIHLPATLEGKPCAVLPLGRFML